MYVPYVRGKQFELLALKELAHHLNQTPEILPIIEPVRARGDALVRCLDALAMADVRVTVVLNPSVGELASGGDGGPQAVVDLLQACQFPESIRLGVQVRAGLDVQGILAAVNGTPLTANPIDLIHHDFSGSSGIHDLVSPETHHLLREKAVARRYRPPLDGLQIKFEDRFPAQRTNLNYVNVPASMFTDDNVYFREDGYAGWGDYATIGDVYSEGGSSPRAVAIHLTYVNSNDGAIWIRHFCSSSNEDTADTAGKFGEAVSELVAFCSVSGLSNPSIDAFRSYYNSGSYPGLGMVKKLSIQNHIYVATEALASTS